MRRKPSFFRRSLGVAVVLGLTSVGSKAHASCERAKQLAFPALLADLEKVRLSPMGQSTAVRSCLVSVSLNVLGEGAGNLSNASARLTRTEEQALSRIAPSMERPLDKPETYQRIAAKLKSQCSYEPEALDPATFTAKDASRCGLVRLPGGSSDLGRLTAKHEAGTVDGGYDAITGDPGAGGLTYGRYQLAADVGGVASFLKAVTCPTGHHYCLPRDFGELGRRLEAAGGVAGARSGTAEFRRTWKQLAQNDRLMQQAQESYHALRIWKPVKDLFERRFGIKLNEASCGLREAAFSVATQHSFPSTERIFTEAVKQARPRDFDGIVTEANRWRIEKLGKPKAEGGFYAGYGDVCYRGKPPPQSFTKVFACRYLHGVGERWKREGKEFSALQAVRCS